MEINQSIRYKHCPTRVLCSVYNGVEQLPQTGLLTDSISTDSQVACLHSMYTNKGENSNLSKRLQLPTIIMTIV